MLPLVHEKFSQAAGHIGRQILLSRGARCSCCNYDGVFHRARSLKNLDHLVQGGFRFPDATIYANDPLSLLVEHDVGDQSGFSCHAVANDQFTLSPPNGNHGVQDFDSRFYRLFHRFALQNWNGLAENGTPDRMRDRAFIIERLTQGIHYPSQEGFPHGNVKNFKQTVGRISRTNSFLAQEQQNRNLVGIEPHDHSGDIILEVNLLAIKAGG